MLLIDVYMLQQQAALGMNQKHLLDAIHQAVQQHDLAERLACRPRFQAPAPATQRKGVLKRIGRLLHHARQRLANRAADRRTHDREDRLGDHLGPLAHRLGQRAL